MWSRIVPILAAMTLGGAVFPAVAQDFHRVECYASTYGGNDGYAGGLVRGAYIGAPLARVPRPSQIVPSPWSYGTYGIPTVSGIPGTPAGQPTVTVINAREPKASRRGGMASAGGDRSAGARIIEMEVPRR